MSNIKEIRGTLAQSVDTLRDRINHLYALDEDNYQAIKQLKARLEKIGALLTAEINRNDFGWKVVGFSLVAGGIGAFMLGCYIDREITKLKKRIDELEGVEETEDTEESDG